MIPKKARKQKACQSCGELFEQRRSTHIACSWPCAILCVEVKKQKAEDRAKLKAEREERKSIRAAREATMTKSDHLKLAQKAFNAYIRERDAALPCICCNRHHPGQYHAGHYLSVGANPFSLRFNENNCHKQASYCNNYKSGNQAQYRINLIEKIGLAEVEKLEGPQEAPHWSIDDIKAIRDKYKAKLKALKEAEHDFEGS